MTTVLPTKAGEVPASQLPERGLDNKNNIQENISKKVKPNHKKVEIVCADCKQLVWRPLKEVNRRLRDNQRAFCSRSCAARAGNRDDKTGKVALHAPSWLQKKYATTYRKAKQQAQGRRGIEFTLTKEEFEVLVLRCADKCEVSGIPFRNTVTTAKNERRPYTPSLDRIDSKGGYSFGNCRLVTVAANFGMNGWGAKVLLDTAVHSLAKEDDVSPEELKAIIAKGVAELKRAKAAANEVRSSAVRRQSREVQAEMH